jgi:hypothetical protein
MTDAVNFLMLIAVSVGSLALGILAAYAILRTAFAVMRPQRQESMVKARASVAGV